LRNTIDAEAIRPVDGPSGRVRKRAGALLGRRAEVWRQQLVNLTLIFSDVLLALVVWEAAFVLQGVWGGEPLSGIGKKQV
jgi:hypothetical protein